MPISAIRKFLQLIKSEEELPEEAKLSEETLESDPKESEENSKFEIRNSELKEDEESEEPESDQVECTTPKESNRAHLTSSVPRAAKPPASALTKGELAEIRAIFRNLDDSEIQRLYKKVTK